MNDRQLLTLGLPSPRLPQRRRGARWSGLISLAVHALATAVLTVFAVARHAPVHEVAVATPEHQEVPRMVFLQMPGPGGGGGGGGNRAPTPPSRASAVGSDPVTLPAARPIAIEAKSTEKPADAPMVLLHSVPLASGTISQIGMPYAPPSVPFSQGPGSGGGVGTGIGTGIGEGAGSGFGPGSGGGFGGGAYRPGTGVTSPTLLSQVRPVYTSEALRLKIQGTVLLDVVVDRDGIPSQIRVARSLDEHGLDVEAVRAVRQWRFSPGRKGETAVDVLVRIVLEFHIH